MSVKYAVIFEQGESNWAAHGKTLDETERNIRESDRRASTDLAG